MHNSRAAEVKRMQRSAEEKRRDVIIRRAAMRMRSQSMSRVFYAWYDYFAELKRQREVSERMLRRMLNQKLHSMFNSWRRNVSKLRTQRSLVENMVVRMKNKRVFATFNTWKYSAQQRKHLRKQFINKSRQWQRQSLSFALKRWYQYNVQVDSAKSLARRRNKGLVSLLFATRRKSAQKAWKIWIKFVWQCRVVDIELRHSESIHKLKGRVSYITSDVKKSVKEFRYKTLGTLLYHSKERGQRNALTKAFYRWGVYSINEALQEQQRNFLSFKKQMELELSKRESLTHWAINVSRIESEKYKSELQKRVAFLTFKQGIMHKRYQNAKLDREMYRQRILMHVSKSISCTMRRHETNKLLRRFCHWKVSIERNKADQAEEKTGNLKELLIHAKDDAQNSILQIVRDRLMANEKHRDFGSKSDFETEYGIEHDSLQEGFL